ncbi:CpaD family pilus assembly protein [Bradyrhizobium lablabi]|uniref:CpaD family pilus assembly protein n=1 Tax=Bradyrhizobium lablabi TaxID=722472 RepID=UPI001BA658A4|nr:CpaD family pilus assembly protein [Bradyrhizobium lablabi]MBR1121075.1 CpaD family pilus assembly protein [Bradyrhizobium lablabi]
MTGKTDLNRLKTLRSLTALVALSAALGACTVYGGEVTASVPPTDYRQRHPIAVQEADRSIVVFVGTGRGGLSPSQRDDVRGLARTWVNEGTGTIVVDVPSNTPNSRAAASAWREIRSHLVAGGVPSRAITMRHYTPDDPRHFAAIRLSYPKITAVAGPCGLWPADLGPNIDNPFYNENKHYHNFGCASQRNLAAMVANPADLEQPRSETPAYTPRRDVAFSRYRKGEPTTTTYPEQDKAKLSDTGK